MPPNHDAMPTLRDLIQRHTDRTGESQRALGKRSGVPHQTLGVWAAGDITRFPDPPTLRAFAAATGYSERTTILAAARTVGLRVEEVSELAAMLPASADRLTKRQQDAVLTVVRAMADPGFEFDSAEDFRLVEENDEHPAEVRNGD